MIIFNLKCDLEHQFEGWFKNKEEFERQIENHMVTCPQCGNENILKMPTASRINKHSNNRKSNSNAEPVNVNQQEIKMISEQFADKLNSFVEENFTYVGDGFPEEVRKIYYGETESKNIYGYATQNEIKSLNEEGVSTLPLPAKIISKDKLN